MDPASIIAGISAAVGGLSLIDTLAESFSELIGSGDGQAALIMNATSDLQLELIYTSEGKDNAQHGLFLEFQGSPVITSGQSMNIISRSASTTLTGNTNGVVFKVSKPGANCEPLYLYLTWDVPYIGEPSYLVWFDKWWERQLMKECLLEDKNRTAGDGNSTQGMIRRTAPLKLVEQNHEKVVQVCATGLYGKAPLKIVLHS